MGHFLVNFPTCWVKLSYGADVVVARVQLFGKITKGLVTH